MQNNLLPCNISENHRPLAENAGDEFTDYVAVPMIVVPISVPMFVPVLLFFFLPKNF